MVRALVGHVVPSEDVCERARTYRVCGAPLGPWFAERPAASAVAKRRGLALAGAVALPVRSH